MPDNWIFATGRRKTAVARVMVRKGNGNMLINNKNPDDYFPTKNQVVLINQPIESSANSGKWEFNITVRGGGFSGQAGAIRHGIARALVQLNSDFRAKLKKDGLLTRDPRAKERKKYGQKGARKRFQFSKR